MKVVVASVLLLGGIGLGFFAGRAARASGPVDAPVTDSSTVVFENDKVRVLLYQTGTGKNICGFGLHSHPAHAYIQLTPARLRVTTLDGKEEIQDTPAGDVGWEPAVTHRVESVSGEHVRMYLVEVKDEHWKPSTGLMP
jgi:hypothetical protein